MFLNADYVKIEGSVGACGEMQKIGSYTGAEHVKVLADCHPRVKPYSMCVAVGYPPLISHTFFLLHNFSFITPPFHFISCIKTKSFTMYIPFFSTGQCVE